MLGLNTETGDYEIFQFEDTAIKFLNEPTFQERLEAVEKTVLEMIVGVNL